MVPGSRESNLSDQAEVASYHIFSEMRPNSDRSRLQNDNSILFLSDSQRDPEGLQFSNAGRNNGEDRMSSTVDSYTVEREMISHRCPGHARVQWQSVFTHGSFAGSKFSPSSIHLGSVGHTYMCLGADRESEVSSDSS